eukprot:GHRR01028799.1.p1 GENE.GHRR01028799.1~~GHRR01028799.1.p1  ORF type:complete len:180 (+),score=37.87 GHRR01028799.1:384-923(+)
MFVAHGCRNAQRLTTAMIPLQPYKRIWQPTKLPMSISCQKALAHSFKATAGKEAAPQDDPLALAFLGDAIWTLYIRRHFFMPPKHFRRYHEAVKPFVTAEGQASIYDILIAGQQLMQQERDLLTRMRRMKHIKLRKRFDTPAAADAYRKATALEVLVSCGSERLVTARSVRFVDLLNYY